MKVLNIFGGPGSGKSTTAAALFYNMKTLGISCELVQEYAKDMVWEGRNNILEDQIYVFAKQQRRIARLKNHDLDWVITDSPIPLGLCYVQPHTVPSSFTDLVMHTFNKYQNHNFLIMRNVAYDPVGRVQKTESEAVIMDDKIQNLLLDHAISYDCVLGGRDCVSSIMNIINHEHHQS